MSALNKSLVAAGLLTLPLLILGRPALAEEASPHTLTANVGLYSQYVFRGLTQTDEDPAIQGGFDYSHKSGVYLGTWGSNVSWLTTDYGAGDAYEEGGSLELDFYGGFRGSIGDSGFTYDLGVLYYWYPGDESPGFNDANTTEIYGALGWKWFTAKYSYSLSDTFGIEDADGTWYLDISAALPLGETGLTLGAHYGMQEYSIDGDAVDEDDASYNDWKISLTYDLGKATSVLGGTTLGVAYTDTDAEEDFYGDLGDSQFVVWVQKVF
jgi:uncharacterized protein (TIGR02001 family)